MIGAVAYDDPAKDAWRGWKWNTIAAQLTGWKRLNPKEQARQLQNKLVLYLVGPDDCDRKRAVARGFSNHNLIAVDIVQERVDEVRARGGFAIRGSLQQLVANWPSDWPLDVIDGDFCSGATNDVLNLASCLGCSQAVRKATVVSLNMMRGRDSQSNCIREAFRSLSNADRDVIAAKLPGMIGVRDIAKHRAATWFANLLLGEWPYSNRFEKALDCDWIRHELNPRTNWYRSKTSGQCFDSVIYNLGFNASTFDSHAMASGARDKMNSAIRQYAERKRHGASNRELQCYRRVIDLCRENEEKMLRSADELKSLESDLATALRDELSRNLATIDDGVRQRIAALRAVRTKRLRDAGFAA